MIKLIKRQIRVRDEWLGAGLSGIIHLDSQHLEGGARRIESLWLASAT